MTPAQLRAILPLCRDLQQWCRHLPLAEIYGVNTPVRRAAFLAQVGHESAHLNTLVENLSYSVRALRATWPHRFPDNIIAAKYARQPEKLGNFVYANRLGNGDVTSGDGYRYRGRGLLQVTGRANYAAAGTGLGLDLIGRPALLESPDHAVRSAALFWQTNHLNELADQGDEGAFREITKKINGGYTGYDDRLALWNKAKSVLGV